jgi:hypothetical protein
MGVAVRRQRREVREILVEVLLARQHRAPRRHAAGAVVQHTAYEPAAFRVAGLHARIAFQGAGEGNRCRAGDAAVERRILDEPQAASRGARHLDDGTAVRLDLHPDVTLGRRAGGVVGEHLGRGRVLVVHHQKGALDRLARDVGVPALQPLADTRLERARRLDGVADLRRQRVEADKVAVEPELLGLAGARLIVEVERRRSGGQRIAPTDEQVPGVAIRDQHLVRRAGDDGLELQPCLVRRHRLAGRRRLARQQDRRSVGGGNAGGSGAGHLQEIAALHALAHHVFDVGADAVTGGGLGQLRVDGATLLFADLECFGHRTSPTNERVREGLRDSADAVQHAQRPLRRRLRSASAMNSGFPLSCRTRRDCCRKARAILAAHDDRAVKAR